MRVLSGIVALAIVAIFAIKNTKFHKKQKPNVPITWKDTIGTVDPRGYRQGTIYYVVNGVTYHAAFEGITDKGLYDLKFTMSYNVDDPEEVQIDSWNPVFVKGEKTHVLAAKVRKINLARKYWTPSPNVVYSYVIPYPDKSRTIKQWIFLPKDFQQRYPNLKEGQYYEVEVWDKNVYRSVLHLDRPVRDSQLIKQAK